jgi:hypothetical protein
MNVKSIAGQLGESLSSMRSSHDGRAIGLAHAERLPDAGRNAAGLINLSTGEA